LDFVFLERQVFQVFRCDFGLCFFFKRWVFLRDGFSMPSKKQKSNNDNRDSEFNRNNHPTEIEFENKGFSKLA
jgi:hypothetical protein